MRKLLTFTLILGSFLVPIQKSQAVEPLTQVSDCSIAAKNTICLESLIAITEDGLRVKGVPIGSLLPEKRTYAPDSVLIANWQQYDFPGIKFEGGVSSILPRLFLYPLGNQDCFYTPCVQGNQYLEITLTPLGKPAGKYLPVVSEACIGKQYTPGAPWFESFGIPITFEVKIRIPHQIMETLGSGGLGRGISDAIISFDDSNPNFTILNLKLKSSPYSSYGCAGAMQADNADLESSQVVYWLWGVDDIRMKSFGKCQALKYVSVVSNAFWTSFPYWDANSGNVQVTLGGPHFKSDGSLNLVTFQAKITTEMAKCLWGIDLSNQSKAEFSLTYNEGGKIEVQTLVAHLEGNVYVLTVAGIHLSSPTLGVKLNQQSTSAPKVDTSTSSTTGTPNNSKDVGVTQKTVKSVSIVCQKGKISRKITGKAPKCPSGYKLKSK